MEQATVEQAEPQGSAAPERATSAPASGDNGAATPASFGSLFKAHVMERASRNGVRAAASSAERETSAADEQPAPSDPDASRPGAAAADVDAQAADTEQPKPSKPSRAERKAMHQGRLKAQEQPATAGDTPPADTSATDDGDPVVARVERVERTVAEGLQRLEGLLKTPTPAEADPSLDGESKAYREMFGDDAEFQRRAEIALHGSQRNQYLDVAEADELAVWASNRKAKDFAAQTVNRQYQANFSAMVLAAAQEFGVEAGAIQKPGTTFRDIFASFVQRGRTERDAELAERDQRIAKLEAASRQLADENEALQMRLPASARPLLTGGAATSKRAAAIADRTRRSGRELMLAGLAKSMTGRRNRPGAR